VSFLLSAGRSRLLPPDRRFLVCLSSCGLVADWPIALEPRSWSTRRIALAVRDDEVDRGVDFCNHQQVAVDGLRLADRVAAVGLLSVAWSASISSGRFEARTSA
jgi:hypothetical protein